MSLLASKKSGFVGFSLKGCQIVAGGRRVAQTTGTARHLAPHPEGVPPFFWHPFRVGFIFNGSPVVSAKLRPPATI